MKMKLFSMILVLFAGLFVVSAFAQETKQPEMSAEEKAMMEAWMKAATPGEHHKHLAMMEGNWKTASKMWMSPGGAPTESTGACENKMILDGHYLHQDCKGPSMMEGMPDFNGNGMTGYDNIQKKYVATWVDNMTTGIMMATGTCEQGGKVHKLSGTYIDPATNKTKNFRWVSTAVSPSKMTFEFFDEGPDGKEFKSMEMTYTKS
jgi:Protein of unknown function (DUF1579)